MKPTRFGVSDGGYMLGWCALLFCLGLAAFTDSLFNYGDIFRQVNSVMFMLISLGLLVRTTTKMRHASREKISERMEALEVELGRMKQREIRDNTARPKSRMGV